MKINVIKISKPGAKYQNTCKEKVTPILVKIDGITISQVVVKYHMRGKQKVISLSVKIYVM